MSNRISRLKFSMICWYMAAAGFYLASTLHFLFGKEEAILNLCLGTSMLCLGLATSIRYREAKREDKADD